MYSQVLIFFLLYRFTFKYLPTYKFSVLYSINFPIYVRLMDTLLDNFNSFSSAFVPINLLSYLSKKLAL